MSVQILIDFAERVIFQLFYNTYVDLGDYLQIMFILFKSELCVVLLPSNGFSSHSLD